MFDTVPASNSLSREVYKWLQSLDLSIQVRNPKWDFANGYLIAEIFSWYFPNEIQLHNYNNGHSHDMKTRNWSLLKLFMKKHKISIPERVIESTIHSREDAAIVLVETLFELTTNRKVKKHHRYSDITFSDENYQQNLPLVCRATAIQSVKNNVKLSEIVANDDFIDRQVKVDDYHETKRMHLVTQAQRVIDRHVEHRIEQRLQHPERFNIQKNLADMCVRRAPSDKHHTIDINSAHGSPSRQTVQSGSQHAPSALSGDARGAGSTSPHRAPSVHFREISVQQRNEVTDADEPKQTMTPTKA